MLFSAEIVFRVCKYRKVRAVWLSFIVSAASFRAREARSSPSVEIIWEISTKATSLVVYTSEAQSDADLATHNHSKGKQLQLTLARASRDASASAAMAL